MGRSNNSKYRILVTDDDPDARLVMRMMVERDGYQVFEADDGQKAIDAFHDIEPDVILMDAMMPNVDGFTAVERISEFPGGKDTPIVMVTALHDDASIERAFKIGATDYITKPVQWSVLRHRLRRLLRTKEAEDSLHQVIEDQKVLHRIDRELGYTLDLKRVLDLATDTAMRRTGASSCAIGWINAATRQLERLTSIGGSSLLQEAISVSELQNREHPFSAVFLNNDSVYEIAQDDLYTRILLPLLVQGKPEGVIVLDGVMTGVYDQSDLDFLVHLATRTAAAIEKTTIYQRSQDYIGQMDRLHDVSTAISSSFNLDDMMQMSTRGMAVLLDGSSGFFVSHAPRSNTFTVRATFVVEGMNDKMPVVGEIYEIKDQAELRQKLFDGVIQFQASTMNLPSVIIEMITSAGYKSGLVIPLTSDDQISGLVVMGESRYERYYNGDEVALARSLSGHVMVMLKQANQFTDVKELEQVKSEMIRMASHDLKNPLLQIGGYFDLFMRTMQDKSNQQQLDFADRIRSGVQKMNTLLEDILNLEKVESQRATSWQSVDIRALLVNVCSGLKPQAELKSQTFTTDIDDKSAIVLGSDVQLKQALTNLVGNGIKYTPEKGTVTVRSKIDRDKFHFEVTDTGYGIPKDRQPKLFERFYRANSPGTEDIPGTGLGLSLVKAVIERHGGEVWFTSEEGHGSTFGLWLPLSN